jgi:hypothetical protein
MRWGGVVLAAMAAVPSLTAQTQTTFYAAFSDGQEAMRQGHWRQAIVALERAVELRPSPAPRVLIYGNNLLVNYYPYSLLARCRLELGETDAAGALLRVAATKGEPASALEPVARRLPRPAESPSPRVQEPPKPDPIPQAKLPEPLPVPPDPLPPVQPMIKLEPPGTPAIGMPPPSAREAAATPPRGTGTLPPLAEAGATAPIEPRPQAPARGPEPVRPLPAPFWISAGVCLAAMAGWMIWKFRRPAPLTMKPAGPSGQGPHSVGPYRILRTLGQGGFATTYLARHRDTGREVALKVLHPHRLHDPEFRKRFRQEAKLGALLEHPHLVRILDPGTEGGFGWIAMDYVAGPTLEAHLKQRGPLPLDEVLTIALGIAEAMAYAHACGVVHRDLKPANVILSDQGPKVLDMGIARELDSSGATTTYAFLGTPLYAAPETQLLAKVGPAADRYCLGVILFEMLAGRPPFQGDTPFAIMDQHRSATPPDLGALRELPPGLARLIERLMDKDPDQRPEDGEILDEIKRFQHVHDGAALERGVRKIPTQIEREGPDPEPGVGRQRREEGRG